MILLHKKGQHIRHKELQANQFAPHHLQSVFMHPLAMDTADSKTSTSLENQAGFRAGFSTIDHLHVVNQLQEKAHEYNILVCFAFVNYEKAFQ